MKRVLPLLLLIACSVAAQTADQTFSFADYLHKNGDDGFAMLEFKRFVFHHPDHERVPEAFRRLAELYISYREDIGGAQRILRALTERYPDTAEGAKAKTLLDFVEVNSDYDGQPLKLWMAAESLEKQKRHDVAAQRLDSLISDYPKARLADDAWFRKAELLRDHLGKPEQAHKHFAELKDRYPESTHAVSAEFEAAATLATIEGRENEAANAFRTFAATYPKHSLADKATTRANEIDKQTLKVERQFDAGFVKPYTVKESRTPKGGLEVDIEVPVGLSQREVKATLEDALVKEGTRRGSPRDKVIVKAYFNYPISRAGVVEWQPGENPVYAIDEQQTRDVIRDVFIDILRRR